MGVVAHQDRQEPARRHTLGSSMAEWSQALRTEVVDEWPYVIGPTRGAPVGKLSNVVKRVAHQLTIGTESREVVVYETRLHAHMVKQENN